MELLGPASRKFLDRVIRNATGAHVTVKVEDAAIHITGDRDSVMKARGLMEKVQGLRLDSFEEQPDGNATAVFVEAR